MKQIILLPIFLLSFSAYAFIGQSVLPKSIKNECQFTWMKNGKEFVVGQMNVLIDLKNTEGASEEKAYLYIDCKGNAPKINRPPYFDFSNVVTSCLGVRITSLKNTELSLSNVFPMRPENIEVISSSKDSKLVLVWEETSTFEIESHKSFSWKMKSKLSGKTFQGHVACE